MRHRKSFTIFEQLGLFLFFSLRKNGIFFSFMTKIGKPTLFHIDDYFLLEPTNEQVNEITHICFQCCILKELNNWAQDKNKI